MSCNCDKPVVKVPVRGMEFALDQEALGVISSGGSPFAIYGDLKPFTKTGTGVGVAYEFASVAGSDVVIVDNKDITIPEDGVYLCSLYGHNAANGAFFNTMPGPRTRRTTLLPASLRTFSLLFVRPFICRKIRPLRLTPGFRLAP